MEKVKLSYQFCKLTYMLANLWVWVLFHTISKLGISVSLPHIWRNICLFLIPQSIYLPSFFWVSSLVTLFSVFFWKTSHYLTECSVNNSINYSTAYVYSPIGERHLVIGTQKYPKYYLRWKENTLVHVVWLILMP